jgi:GntR family transcriptional regulator, phosphonate transport system regulatory protein
MVEASMTLAQRLPRDEGVALWRQIAQRLEARIAAGALPAGQRLPTEAELSEGFGVNRHTIRRAMEDLSSRGLVRVEQGRGSFVAEEVVEYPLGSRTRFSEIIRAQSREPSGRILRLQETTADARIAELLRIRRGRPVLVAQRLSFANRRPINIGLHTIPLTRFPRIAEHLERNPSISAAFAASGVPDYRRQITRITARMPTPEEADLLAQSRSRPILLTESVNVDREGTPVEVSIGHHAAGRMQLVVESA